MIWTQVNFKGVEPPLTTRLGFDRLPVKGDIIAPGNPDGEQVEDLADEDKWPSHMVGKEYEVDHVILYCPSPDLSSEPVVTVKPL